MSTQNPLWFSNKLVKVGQWEVKWSWLLPPGALGNISAGKWINFTQLKSLSAARLCPSSCYMDTNARNTTPSFEISLISCLISCNQNAALQICNAYKSPLWNRELAVCVVIVAPINADGAISCIIPWQFLYCVMKRIWQSNHVFLAFSEQKSFLATCCSRIRSHRNIGENITVLLNHFASLYHKGAVTASSSSKGLCSF